MFEIAQTQYLPEDQCLLDSVESIVRTALRNENLIVPTEFRKRRSEQVDCANNLELREDELSRQDEDWIKEMISDLQQHESDFGDRMKRMRVSFRQGGIGTIDSALERGGHVIAKFGYHLAHIVQSKTDGEKYYIPAEQREITKAEVCGRMRPDMSFDFIVFYPQE